MTQAPPNLQDDYQALLERLVSRPGGARGPLNPGEIARIAAGSLRLEGFDVTAEELERRYGPPGQ